jgi:predicted house-cleaning noncanonical NTP pyrophosphatase (MazG superfamily)
MIAGNKVSEPKLVRDGIPQIIRDAGLEPIIRVAEPDECPCLLRQKLVEEVKEFLESGEPEELADVLEVVAALAAEFGLDPVGLEDIRAKKKAERGGFSLRLVWYGNRESN